MASLTLPDVQALHAQLRRELHEEFAAVVMLMTQQHSALTSQVSAQICSDLRGDLQKIIDWLPAAPPFTTLQEQQRYMLNGKRSAEQPRYSTPSDETHAPEGDQERGCHSDWRPHLWAVDDGHESLAVSETDALLGASRTKKHSGMYSDHDSSPPEDPLQAFVENAFMDSITASAVVLNSVTIAIETQYAAAHVGDHMPSYFFFIDLIFATVFNSELVLRIYAFGYKYFKMPGWHWNLFDLSLVVAQDMEIFTEMFAIESGPFESLVRTLRLLRICRMARILRLVDELRHIGTSIVSSMRLVFWTLVLMAMLIYGIAVVLTPVISEWRVNDEVQHASDDRQLLEDVERYYGTLVTTALTLYESISCGLSWDIALQPLMSIHPMLGVLFCMYIAFAVFAILNVVTGVFVERATVAANREREEHEMGILWDAISKSFGRSISLQQFRDCLQQQDFRAFFEDIGAGLRCDSANFHQESAILFKLLDQDGGGSIDRDEFFDSCLRLRGYSKALDLLMHANSTRNSFEALEDQVTRLGAKVTWICETLLKQS